MILNFKRFCLNNSKKLVISLLIIVIVLVGNTFVQPEAMHLEDNTTVDNTQKEVKLIGESSDSLDAFGSINIQETKGNGYGYIKNNSTDKASFGLIQFNNKLNDSLFIKRVHQHFPKQTKKFYQNSGISYALIDNQQLYFENKGLSHIIGFNGPLELGILIDLEGHLDKVIYLASEETLSYINKILRSNYFDQYKNISTEEKHVIDAVSGATITTVAAAKAVDEIYHLVEHSSILKDYLTGNYKNFAVHAQLNNIWIINLILLILVFSVLYFKKLKKRKFLTILSIFTVLWLGFYLNASFTYLLFLKSFTTTGISVFTVCYLCLILLTTVWSKNTYCKHICPFGNAQKLMFKISPFKKSPPIFKNKHLRLARYLISIMVIMGYLSGLEILSEYELFPYFFSINTSYIIFGISVFAMLISMRIPNLWCRALCPTGCVLDTLSDVSENKLIKFK